QNHYDSWLLSGVSGHGARSFYYPEKSQKACAGCHMPLEESKDFGARLFAGTDGKFSIHDHTFAAGNTGLPALRGYLTEVEEKHRKFLEGTMRVDIFGVKEDASVDSKLLGPIRPVVPPLKPGSQYLLEIIVRTLKVGHEFTQGTVDSNEVWLDVSLQSGDRLIGQSGGMDTKGEVDRRSHFMNVFMLDRHGNRVNRRNPQDIFTPLYNHQIPPGSGQVVHYSFRVPEDLSQPITATVKLQYRKFDYEYMEIVHKRQQPNDNPIATNESHVSTPVSSTISTEPGVYRNRLPVLTLATDTVVFPMEGLSEEPKKSDSKIPGWQRWNDYGIGLFLEGKSELKQAEQAFQMVEKLNRFDGPLNLARVYLREGRIDEAGDAVQRAAKATDPVAPEWTLAWFSGLVNREQGRLVEAEANFRSIVDQTTEERRLRGFDFSRDIEVLNTLGRTLFDRAEQLRLDSQAPERESLLREAAKQFHRSLAIDSENMNAHYNLGLIHGALGETKLEKKHKSLHLKYKPDDNAQGLAVRLAREKYPAANSAAEPLVIYPLHTAPE
ncbi:MAG TPA: tetratricopeptide repeat protein, partial [Pirellula sp.]|nr:tetratricopeptide repeat protein [Pirellula sp.]